MYVEGSTKGFLAILAAILAVVASAYWHQTLFVFRFLWDIFVLNVQPLLRHGMEFLRQYWPF